MARIQGVASRVVLVALVLGLAFGLGPVTAQGSVVFEDGFEYDDSLSNHGWVIEGGDPHTVTDPENAGNRVALVLSRAEDIGVFPSFSRDFDELALEAGMRMSIEFYDTGESCGNCDVHVYAFFDGDAKQIEVGWYNNSTNFEYSHNFDGSSGHLYEPFGLRGVGWHIFEWVVEQNGGINLVDRWERDY